MARVQDPKQLFSLIHTAATNCEDKAAQTFMFHLTESDTERERRRSAATAWWINTKVPD